jgi:hypothetical protein
VRALAFLFDVLLFSSLTILALGFSGSELALLPIGFALSGIIAQALFLRRFGLSRARRWRIPFLSPAASSTTAASPPTCRSCARAISADARICRHCLASVDEEPESQSSAQMVSQAETEQVQVQRWWAATNTNVVI